MYNSDIFADVQVSCVKHVDHYIPPLWIMCMESVAHLMVMLNFSSNFLIYCSVSKQFKLTLSRACLGLCLVPPARTIEETDYAELETVALPTPILELSAGSIFNGDAKQEANQTNIRETDMNL